MSTKNVVRYWRDSLLDADLSALELTKDNHIRISEAVLGGQPMDAHTTLSLFKTAKGGDNESKYESDPIPVIVAPIVTVKKRSAAYGKRQVNCPLFVPALLNHEGILEGADHDNLPWIPRTLLEPTSSNLVLGNIDDFTAFLDSDEPQNDEDPRVRWVKLIQYSMEMFAHVAGSGWRRVFENAGYRIEEEAALLPTAVMRGISSNIIRVYDEMLETGSYPPLITTYARLAPDPPKGLLKQEDWSGPAKLHLGSFGKEFAISSSQRQALNHFLTLPPHTVLAISGPPGTGKTTLLHSVIASLWVQAALDGGQPPVIVASSTNNQAVTNVIESLSGSGGLKRWIDVDSFGLYLVNSKEKIEAAAGQNILTSDNRGNGFPAHVQNETFIESAHVDFVVKCDDYFDQDINDLDQAVDALHAELEAVAQGLREGIDKATKAWFLRKAYQTISENFGNADRAREALSVEMAEPLAELAQSQVLDKSWQASLRDGAGLMGRLKFLSKAKKKDQERRAAFLATYLPDLAPASTNEDVDRYIEQALATAQKRVDQLQEQIDTVSGLESNLDQAQKQWAQWRRKYEAPQLEIDDLFVLEKPIGSENTACLHNWLDTNLRHKLFVLATHYWEGRWLQTILEQGFLEPDFKESRNEISQRAKWRRYAMLTPCFVTTMHSGPRFFDYYDGDSHSLIDYIDLLIIDEAGQVTPEVSGGMFALARQALVVGDIQQIEPVWSVPPQVDRGNLQWFGLLNSAEQWLWLRQKGLMASSGSVMQMAQSVSPFQSPPENGAHYERGMFLAEHRRCVPEVIGYCNELAYKGRLRPMRQSVENYPWPHMGFAHVKGVSARSNGSRKNDREALALAGWIAENRQQLEAYYSKKGEYVDIENIVGIVTPFSAQKRAIQAALKKHDIGLSKVGTVHALQGGERPLVLFSPVYCSRDNRSYFFDQGPNMLNVAVSRAKDSFLVFGDMDVFDPSLDTPSGVLARFLFADEGNEIADYAPPSRTNDDFGSGDLHLVNKLVTHVGTLSRAFERAQDQLVIVSPFLRWRAVQADGLAQKTAAAVGRGVRVTIYVDDGFNERLQMPSAAKAASALQENGAEIKLCHNIHSKILCIDRDIFVEGSFNWLSAERVQNEHVRHETSIIYMGPRASEFIGDTIRDVETAVIG